MRCTKCDKENPDAAAHCAFCGAAVSDTRPPAVGPELPRQGGAGTKARKRVALTALALAVAACLTIWGLSRARRTHESSPQAASSVTSPSKPAPTPSLTPSGWVEWERQISTLDGDQVQPTWVSGNGIWFISREGGIPRPVVAGVDSGSPTREGWPESDSPPAWTPDGCVVVWQPYGPDGLEVGEASLLVAKTPKPVTTASEGEDLRSDMFVLIEGRPPLPEAPRDPTISPDGRLVAFVSDYKLEGGEWMGPGLNASTWMDEDRPGPYLYLVRIDGSGFRPLTDAVGADYPAFAPDGRSVYFLQGGEVWTIGVDGRNQRELTEDLRALQDGGMSASPKGGWLAVTLPSEQRRGSASAGNIWLVATDSEKRMQLTEGGTDAHPRFSPDGTMIAFEREQNGDRHIWVLKLGPLADA